MNSLAASVHQEIDKETAPISKCIESGKKFTYIKNPVKPNLIREELFHPVLNNFLNTAKFYTLF